MHGWSSTPARDLIWHVLGVTPGAPGYSMARVAPRLGALDWAKGKVPCPQGMISVEITRTRLILDSPVSVQLDLEGQPAQHLPPGRHDLAL